MVSIAKISESSSIADIHYSQLNSDFLSKLGRNFLDAMYKSFISDKEVIVLVHKDNHKILGFIAGSKNFDKQFKKIIIHNFFILSLNAIPSIIKNPLIIKDILKTFLYTLTQPNVGVKAELISIAVDGNYQGKGIGKKLMYALEEVMRVNKMYTYKVSANANNKSANVFYITHGFKKKGQYKLYDKKVNLYIKKIT